jgi:hypothetical protein
MRRFSTPESILLILLVCVVPVFGQTTTPLYPAPETTGFRFFFVQVMAMESLADRVKAQGKDDTATRAAVQRAAQLTDQEAALLKQVAQQCNADYAAETARGTSAVNNLRTQAQNASVTAAAVSQQISALEAQRASVIGACMQALETGMGFTRFLVLRGYVGAKVAVKHVDVVPQPGTHGAPSPNPQE